MIRISNASSTDTLIGALEEVEGAKHVLILLEKDEEYVLVANCGPESIKDMAAEAIVICNMKFNEDKDAN